MSIKKSVAGVLMMILVLTARSQNLNSPNKRGPMGTQVNTMSGNLFIPRTDIYIPARGFDLDMRFYYNSYNCREDFGYGNGWSFLYAARYKNDTLPGGKILVWGDGREDIYDSVPGGSYRSPRGFFSKLVQQQAGQFKLVEKDSTTWFFNNSLHKKVTRVEEPNGNFIIFNYTDTLLTSLVNAAGQTITFTYNPAGKLATMVDAIAVPSRTFSYAYDAAGNLQEVTDPLGGKHTYTYLVNGPMKTMADKNNNKIDIIYFPNLSVHELIGCNKRLSFSYDTTSKKTIIIDHFDKGGANQVTTYAYQRLENLSWITSMTGNCCGFNVSYEYDDQGNVLQEKDANGNISTYTYDNKGNMLTATDPLGQVSTYTWSAQFNKITTYKDPAGNLYVLSYDAKGNLIQLVTPGNNNYAATYNTNGDVTSSTDPKGNVFTYNYDAYGNPTTVTGPNGYSATLSFDARGNLLAYTDARGNTATAEYDILRRLKKITDPINNITTYTYDAEGNMVTYKNKNDETSTFSYDASNRLVKFTGPTGNESQLSYDAMDQITGIKNELGYESTFGYDTRSRLSNVKDALGNTTLLNYDGIGNITALQLPNGQMLNYTYDKLNRVTKIADATGTIANYTYDANGNIITFTNGTGATTSATYDSLNRVKQVTDPLGNSTSCTYDKNNKVLSVNDREGRTSHYSYDSLNRVKTSYTDNNGSVITLGYDAENNVTSLKDQNNNITTYTYDSLNRRKTMTYPDGKYMQYWYDKKNNLVNVRLTDGTTIVYGYDTLNRMISRTLPGGEVFSYTYDKLGRVTTATNNSGTATFTYDALDRLTTETLDGRTTRYNYSIAGRTQTTIYPDSTTVIKEFDTRNRLTRILKDSATIAAYAYSNADQLINKTFANGVTSTMQYDFANRLNNISTSGGSIQNTTFTYDKEMNITAVNRLNNPVLSEQFTYDNGYRLTHYKRGPAGSPVIQNTYTYDAVGNRTAANLNGTGTTYTINNLNQVAGVNSTSFTFDDRGNITYDGIFYKTYDAENRLKKDSASPLVVTGYNYDALGRRITKVVNGNILKYSYSGVAQIEERNSSNTLLNRTVFTGFLTPVLNERNGNAYYYHQNEHNSVEAISNSSGRLVERYEYDAYGKLSRYDSLNNPLSSSIAGNRFGFTGQEYDSATGSYRFYFRNYSPETGVFNQRDLIEYGDATGMYQYVGNNPANGIDIWGLEKKDCKKNGRDLLADFDTFSDSKTFLEFADISLPGPAGAVVNVVTFPVDMYKTANSINKMSEVKVDYNNPDKVALQNSVDMHNMHGGDAIKNGTNAAIGATTIVALAAGTAGAPVVAGAAAAGTAVFVVDKGSEQYFKYTETADWEYKALKSELEAKELYINQGKTPKERREREAKWLNNQRKREQYRREWEERQKCPEGGTRKPPPPGEPGNSSPMTVIVSLDPNEIIGPEGQPDKKWVSVKDRMSYTILCENDKSATAPARYIRISTPVEPKQDATAFQLGGFGFNNQEFSVPTGISSYYQRLDCRDSMGLYVDVVAGYDQLRNEIFWEFQSIDPLTQLPTEEPLKGLLFLQDSTQPNYGHGYVTFSIKPRSNSITLDTISAKAKIVFDNNDTIPTNVYTNTIDAYAPTSSMNDLPDFTPNTEVTISYSGADDAGGVGLKSYSIYVSDNDDPPQLYAGDFTKTDTTFYGIADHKYKFYLSATDSVGNVEELRLLDSVRITTGEQVICPNGHITFDARVTGATYQWQADNGTGFTNITEGGIYSGTATSVLSLTNAPTSMYGYQYRCLINGSPVTEVFLLKFGLTWEGTVDNAWENPANWSCNSLPDANTDIIINSGKAHYPQINSNVTIRTLRMNPGASGTVNTGFTLTIVK